MLSFRSFDLVLCGTLWAASLPTAAAQANMARQDGPSGPAYMIVRSDDAGMSHSVNVALERLIASGLPLSVSVMFPTPWHQEAVEMLKRHPEVAVGVHLTLNSEWKGLRWGPVAGMTAVPSLVDADGLFFPTSEALYHNHPDPRDVERELRAQLVRARRSGLRIDYVDYHMGTVTRDSQFRAIAERLAREYGLGMAEYFGEARDNPQYAAAPPNKGDSLAALLARVRPGVTLLVTHVGLDDAELGALVDMNTDGGLAEMSRNRQGELDALTSSRFRDAVRAGRITLVTYRQLIEMRGLQSMRRPEDRG
jgi:predicted glycoside hydrolase/deacetylase ChbG (UPF0249 family)